jgi:hypothetical protein
MPLSDEVKRPLLAGQFVWAVSKKDGKYKPIIGPDPLEATDDDIFVIPDSEDPTKVPIQNPNKLSQSRSPI